MDVFLNNLIKWDRGYSYTSKLCCGLSENMIAYLGFPEAHNLT